jgi:hypothetical protein
VDKPGPQGLKSGQVFSRQHLFNVERITQRAIGELAAQPFGVF